MTIKIIYNERDFFNNPVQMEAKCPYPGKEDIKRSFAFLKKIMMQPFIQVIVLFTMITIQTLKTV